LNLLTWTEVGGTKTAKTPHARLPRDSDAEDLGKTQTGSPPTEGPTAGGVGYKSSAVAEMGDSGHNRHDPKRGGV